MFDFYRFDQMDDGKIPVTLAGVEGAERIKKILKLPICKPM